MIPRRHAVRAINRVILCILPGASLLACASTAGKPDHSSTLVDTRWVLSSLTGGTITAPPPTLAFDEDGRVHGSSGVNRFGGECTIEGTEIRFGPLMSTKMAGPPDRMELERRYLEVLGRSNRWTVTKGRLTLADGEGTLAVFEAEPSE